MLAASQAAECLLKGVCARGASETSLYARLCTKFAEQVKKPLRIPMFRVLRPASCPQYYGATVNPR